MPAAPCDRYHVTPLRLAHCINVLSVDVEHWYHMSCADSTRYLLDIFSEHAVRATFFILGKVAEQQADLVREIHARGHEIASHGWSHTPLPRLTPAQFRTEVIRSTQLLNAITDQPVIGFRAPVFSILRDTYWALDILAECGVRYDSSIFPIGGARYGIPDFPRAPVRYTRNGLSLVEVPLSTVRWCGLNWPVSGGGYFRLLPGRLIAALVQRINREGVPFVTYCHPYEFDQRALLHLLPFTPFSWWGARRDELKTNMFRHSMRGKLARLLRASRFTSFRELLKDEI